jgi:putative ABC transport system permease protein
MIANATGGAQGEVSSIQDPHAIWLGAPFHRKKGDHVRFLINDRVVDFTVAGVLQEKSGEAAVLDLALADELLHKHGALDRILIHVPLSRSIDEWEALLRKQLPPGLTLERQGAHTRENRRMLEAFRWNLRVLSYIALVVGAFLIYNTISVSVVRRRAEIGIARAVGASRAVVLAAFLGEAAAFGVVGGVLGIALGRLMAEGAVRLVASTVQSLYVSSTPAPIVLTGGSVLLGFAIAIGVSLLSAFSPAWEAAQVSPVEAMARGRVDYQARIQTTRDLWLSAILGAGAAASAYLPAIAGKPLFGYLSALLLIGAGALAIPAIVAFFCLRSAAILQKIGGVEAMLAGRSLLSSLRRTSVLTAALATAIAMMAAVGIMVGSFRETVTVWMDNQLQADLFLRPAGSAAADRHPTIASDVPDRIAKLAEVAAVERFRAYSVAYDGLPVTLGGADTNISAQHGKTVFMGGEDRQAIYRQLPTGNFAIVSEPFANKHRVRKGDSITLSLGGTNVTLRVLGIYYDYSSERGYIIVDRGTLLRYLPDPAPSNLAVYLKPGIALETGRAAVERACAGRRIMVFSNASLRVEAIRIFDRTFAITYALEGVAVFVAVMGVAGALLALVIDRRRELALLRFLGGSARQIRGLILFEAGLLGTLANAIGLALGILLSFILIYVINKQSFGWTIQFHWPVAVLCGALAVVFAATLISGLYPARIATRLNPIEVIHEE